MLEKPSQEIDRRFGEFADLCLQFSKELLAVEPEFAGSTRSETVSLNNRIARTVFSKWWVDIASLLYVKPNAGFREVLREL